MELAVGGNIADDGRAFRDFAGGRRPEELHGIRLAVRARRGLHADDETRELLGAELAKRRRDRRIPMLCLDDQLAVDRLAVRNTHHRLPALRPVAEVPIHTWCAIADTLRELDVIRAEADIRRAVVQRPAALRLLRERVADGFVHAETEFAVRLRVGAFAPFVQRRFPDGRSTGGRPSRWTDS